MGKYRKMPVIIEAQQLTEDNFVEVCAWMGVNAEVAINNETDEVKGLFIGTLEGTMLANMNDWIIKGVNGELYPCKPDMFEKTYEPATEPQNTQKEVDAVELLKEYESWEADLISDNEMWWPYVDKDRISGKTYDKMIELQGKRNEILYPEKYRKKYVCRLDEQQCREECEYRNTDIEKCPFVTIKVEQPQEGSK